MAAYYNRFDPSKRWFELLPIPGRRLQSAEVAELQSMSIYRDRRIGDVLFGTGHIIDGCQISVDDAKTQADITKGSIYYDGMIYDIAGASVVITGMGQEVIGLKVTYEIITHEDDPTLKDPAIGYQNYGMPGMDRRVANLNWVVNDPAAFPVFRLQDGVVVLAAVPPELEGITPILARRTYDTSGSFLVFGMDGFIEALDEDYVNLVIETGKAYVLGREIDKLIPTKIPVAKAKTTRQVVNETKTYQTGVNEYSLNSTPVKQINILTAIVEKTEDITRGSLPGTTDLLPKTPVVAIVSISQGVTTYQQGIDYQQTGDSVDWSLDGTEPDGGSTYSVTYRYIKTMISGTDYALNGNNVEFLAGDLPVDGSTFQITYDFYLGRRDLYYLEPGGDFEVISGQPDMYPYAPGEPPNVLALGEIYFPPDAEAADIVVTNYRPQRLTMLELRAMLERLERAEYNMAITELDTIAQTSDPDVARVGTMTDNFTNFEKSDIYHPLWEATIDPDNKTLVLPPNYEEHDLVVDEVNTTAVLKGRLYMLPYTEEVILEQNLATECMNVNPYAVWGNVGIIFLDPSEDVWMEVTHIHKTITSWWVSPVNRRTSHTTTALLLDEQIETMRQIPITIKGENFLPDSDNIQVTFDGVPVELTPVAPTAAGTNAGTVRADVDGKFTATFVIPPDIRSGTREVRAFNYV